jgi:uncharacterized protein
MKRNDEKRLLAWLSGVRRKPLVLRGARQVGKSTLVRQFAADRGLILNEINLEQHLALEQTFASLDVKKIRSELDALVGRSITAPQSLLFLDEIQAVPSALQALRYLYENLPDLPVIAAGSLLEFTLSQHTFSMPVGRIDYHHLGPMLFREFLEAVEPTLCHYLDAITPDTILPEMAHQKLLERMRHYFFVGGMPEAVQAFAESGSLEGAAAVHRRIISTYEDDFSKYARHRDLALIQQVFRRIPRMVGEKVKYVNIAREELSRDVKSALQLLNRARVCHRVYSSTCSGVPLQADINEFAYKLLFLDVGLMNAVCGLDWIALSRMEDTRLVNEGAVAEQFAGQHLAYRAEGLDVPEVVYWLREGRECNAEVDYVVSRGEDIFPIEIKAGKSGTLRSLHQFATHKSIQTAIRFDMNQPSRQTITCHIKAKGQDASCRFQLLSLPLYAIGELGRLLDVERQRPIS